MLSILIKLSYIEELVNFASTRWAKSSLPILTERYEHSINPVFREPESHDGYIRNRGRKINSLNRCI